MILKVPQTRYVSVTLLELQESTSSPLIVCTLAELSVQHLSLANPIHYLQGIQYSFLSGAARAIVEMATAAWLVVENSCIFGGEGLQCILVLITCSVWPVVPMIIIRLQVSASWIIWSEEGPCMSLCMWFMARKKTIVMYEISRFNVSFACIQNNRLK